MFTYTAEQQSAIQVAVEAAKSNSNSFVDYRFSESLVQADQQTFAVFGRQAYELFKIPNLESESGDCAFEYLPVITQGRAILELPDEGRSGIATLMRCVKRNYKAIEDQWTVVYISCGWIYSKELYKYISVSDSWCVDLEARNGWGAYIKGNPKAFGSLPMTERLAEVAAENDAFKRSTSRQLIEMGDKRPVYRGTVFAVVNHPTHGMIAVTPSEFDALGLPECDAENELD